MFETTLKYINLFILPNPKFTIPESHYDIVYRGQQLRDPDNSHTSNFTTPTKNAANMSPFNELRTRHRNTICCGEIPPSLSDISFFKFEGPKHASLSPFDSFHSEASVGLDIDSRNTQPRVRIVTPPSSPTSSTRRRLNREIAKLYCPSQPKHDGTSGTFSKFFQMKSVDKGKGKEKRNSAPPILHSPRRTYHITGHNYDRDSNSPQSTSPILSAPALSLISSISSPENHFFDVAHQIPLDRTTSKQDPPYTSKSFELDLSPIAEDSRTFSEPFDAMQELSNASTSSYGELLDDGATDYYSLSYYGSFGGFQMDNITTEHANAYTQDSTQGFGDIQDTDWSSDQFQAIEDSLLIPELMLTVPTPEVGYAPVDFTSRANASLGSCGDALIGHRGTQRLTSDASLGPNVVEWSPLSLYLGTDLQLSSEKRVCEASSGRDDRIYSAIEPSRTLPGGSLLNAIARKLDISRTSGFAKNRPSGDGKLGHVRRFWKRFSAIGTPVPSANGKSDQGSNIFDECIGATENLTSADRPMATTCLSPGAEASAETWAEKRHSRLPSFSAGACVIEEGEHAASRLFGTSNTGRTKDNCEKHVNERQARVDKENNSKAGRQTRRHSFGFDLKDLNGRKRHLRNDSLLDVESTTVETGSKRFWRRTYSPLE